MTQWLEARMKEQNRQLGMLKSRIDMLVDRVKILERAEGLKQGV